MKQIEFYLHPLNPPLYLSSEALGLQTFMIFIPKKISILCYFFSPSDPLSDRML